MELLNRLSRTSGGFAALLESIQGCRIALESISFLPMYWNAVLSSAPNAWLDLVDVGWLRGRWDLLFPLDAEAL